MNNGTTNKTEIKNIKHTFTADERNSIGLSLAQAIADKRGVEAEFDQVKASYKSKVSEKEARIDNLSTSLVNGFDYRNVPCVVVYDVPAKKKNFFIEDAYEHAVKADLLSTLEPVLVEDMTPNDFQQELIEAESKFECREEIDLFPPTERDYGILVVGRFNNRWFSALRIAVGKFRVDERLDSEQKSFKLRSDAVNRSGKQALTWFKETMPKDAKGFEEPILKAIAAHKDREE